MAGVLQHLRSSTLNKRPNPASMVDGQIAINYASGSPGAFFKDTNGNLVKVGPVHVGATAPNVSPASGGTSGNSLGEQWLDTSGGTYVFKIWDGAAWRSEAGEFVNSTGDTMTGSLTMGPSANLIFEGSTDDGFETTLTVVDPTADRTITLPNVSGTVVTTGDSGTVTSTMIADGTIVNADVNASAAIAGTKISPNFGSQNVVTTGNVGIGTTSVVGKLQVNQSADNEGITLSHSGRGSSYVQQRLAGVTNDGHSFAHYNGTNTAILNGSGRTEHYWNINDTERARIDSSGRLLVGTSSARSNFSGTDTPQFQVEGNSFNTSTISVVAAQSTGGGNIELGSTGGTTVGGTGTVTTNGYLGSIHFLGGNGTNLLKAAAIDCQVDGTVSGGGANDMPGRLVFSVTADGASSPTERMRITSSGSVFIGNTGSLFGSTGAEIANTGTAAFSADSNYPLLINRQTTDGTIVEIRRGWSTVGTISVTTTATAYNTSSDYRLKENVTPVTDGITRLQQLKPSRFNFIADPDKTVDGFLAHEVQTIVPEAITGEKDAVDDEGNPVYQGIDQSKLVPLLTAALQEAIAKIETLEQRLNDAGIN